MKYKELIESSQVLDVRGGRWRGGKFQVLSLNCLGTNNLSHNLFIGGFRDPFKRIVKGLVPGRQLVSNMRGSKPAYDFAKDEFRYNLIDIHGNISSEGILQMNSDLRYQTIKNQIIAILDNNPKINYICLQEVDGRLKQILQVSILNVNDWEWRPGLQRTWNGMIDSEEDRNNNPEWDYAYTVTKKNQREYYNCSSPITIKSAHLKDNGYGNPVGKEPIEDILNSLSKNIYIGDLNTWDPKTRDNNNRLPTRSLLSNSLDWQLITLDDSALVTQNGQNSVILSDDINDSLDGVLLPRNNQPKIKSITYDIRGLDKGVFHNPNDPKPLFNINRNQLIWNIVSDHRPFLVTIN